MEGLLIVFLSALAGLMIVCYLVSRSNGKCHHAWEHRSTSRYKYIMTGRVDHEIHHHVCIKCLKTKDVRIG